MSKSEIQFGKVLVLLNGLVPAILLASDAWHDRLGANPINFAIRTTGMLSLVFLMLTLAITPAAHLAGWNWLANFRRIAGLYAFAYALLHFTIYFVYDRAMSVGSTLTEITSRVYLMIGTLGVLLMLPLAVTSTDAMIRRLGAKRWKLLHRLTYLVAIAGVTHYYLLVKADVRQPIAFAIVLALLLFYRFAAHYRKLSRFYGQAKVGTVQPVVQSNDIPVRNGRPVPWSGKLRVIQIIPETPNVRTFRLTDVNSGPLPFTHLPGQFLTLSLMIDGKQVKRSYTIASSPSRTAYCELTIKREAYGKVSQFMHDHIHPGDLLQVSAPAGRFTFTGIDDQAVVLIGRGVGITPLMSKVRYLTDRSWPGEIHLFYSVKSPAELIFADELRYLERRHPNLHLCLTATAADTEAWEGHTGRIDTKLLAVKFPNFQSQPIHICGPEEFNRSLKAQLLEAGVPLTRIHMESFGGKRTTALAPAAVPEMQLDSREPESELEEFASPEEAAEIRFSRSGRTAFVAAETTVLDAAEQQRIPLDSDCRVGICGTCKVKLLAGQVVMDTEDALDNSDRAMNLILACQARCRGAVEIEA